MKTSEITYYLSYFRILFFAFITFTHINAFSITFLDVLDDFLDDYSRIVTFSRTIAHSELESDRLVFFVNNIAPLSLVERDCIQNRLMELKESEELNFIVELEAYKDLSQKQYVLIVGFKNEHPDFTSPIKAEKLRAISCKYK